MSDYKAILEKEIQELKDKVAAAQDMPEELRAKVGKDIVALERSVALGSYDEKYEKVSRYIEWVLKVPWTKETEDTLDIEKTKAIFASKTMVMVTSKPLFYFWLVWSVPVKQRLPFHLLKHWEENLFVFRLVVWDLRRNSVGVHGLF